MREVDFERLFKLAADDGAEEEPSKPAEDGYWNQRRLTRLSSGLGSALLAYYFTQRLVDEDDWSSPLVAGGLGGAAGALGSEAIMNAAQGKRPGKYDEDPSGDDEKGMTWKEIGKRVGKSSWTTGAVTGGLTSGAQKFYFEPKHLKHTHASTKKSNWKWEGSKAKLKGYPKKTSGILSGKGPNRLRRLMWVGGKHKWGRALISVLIGLTAMGGHAAVGSALRDEKSEIYQ